jgi:hypothetical protein
MPLPSDACLQILEQPIGAMDPAGQNVEPGAPSDIDALDPGEGGIDGGLASIEKLELQ